jgi:hypothetical protein
VAQVDADERHAQARRVSRQAQHGAVAAHRDGQVRPREKLVRRIARRHQVGRVADVAGGALVEPHRDAAGLQERDKVVQRFGHARTIRLGDDGDGFEGLGHWAN